MGSKAYYGLAPKKHKNTCQALQNIRATYLSLDVDRDLERLLEVLEKYLHVLERYNRTKIQHMVISADVISKIAI